MTGKTHIVGGITAASVCTLYLSLYQPNDTRSLVTWGIYYVFPAAVGSLFPDIDHMNSQISRSNIFTKLLSAVIRSMAGHRGKIHSPFIMGLICLILYLFIRYIGGERPEEIVIGFGLGYLSHLILDMFNKPGISLLYPFVWDKNGKPKRYHILTIKEGGFTEFMIRVLLWVVMMCLIYRLLTGKGI